MQISFDFIGFIKALFNLDSVKQLEQKVENEFDKLDLNIDSNGNIQVDFVDSSNDDDDTTSDDDDNNN